ncbi:HAD hydrolase-like protein [Secundilactobacillus collinoides]|nr:HAD hydrolase-like protein [Secundilactobacillus collinoides]
MMIKTVLFDLDGTIINSEQGILNAIKYAVHKLNRPTMDDATLRQFIGPSLVGGFQTIAGYTHEEAVEATEAYREYYRDGGLFEDEVYARIPEALGDLQQQYDFYIATAKPESFAEQIIDHFHLDGYFKGIYGATFDETRIKKADIIGYALNDIGITDSREAVMVGDRDSDILGGHSNALAGIGVTYGFGSLAELQAAKSEQIIASPTELPAAVLALN